MTATLSLGHLTISKPLFNETLTLTLELDEEIMSLAIIVAEK